MNKTILFTNRVNGDSVRFERLADGSVFIVSSNYEEDNFASIRVTADQEQELFNWLAETRGDK